MTDETKKLLGSEAATAARDEELVPQLWMMITTFLNSPGRNTLLLLGGVSRLASPAWDSRWSQIAGARRRPLSKSRCHHPGGTGAFEAADAISFQHRQAPSVWHAPASLGRA
jgi:hypothetical protein